MKFLQVSIDVSIFLMVMSTPGDVCTCIHVLYGQTSDHENPKKSMKILYISMAHPNKRSVTTKKRSRFQKVEA